MQPAATTRLFVFTTAASAQRYRNVLAAQHFKYGQSGRVFLCTYEMYAQLLRAVCKDDKATLSKLRQRDLGLLLFGEPSSAEAEYYEATLSKESLELHRLATFQGYQHAIIAEFDRLSALDEGQQDPGSGVLRWREAFGINQVEWRKALGTLFETKEGEGKRELQEGDVYHLIFFRCTDPHGLAEAVADAMEKLAQILQDDQSDVPLIKDWWFGQWSDAVDHRDVRDGKFHGSIDAKGPLVERFPNCLIVRFHNPAALRTYYEHPQHSEGRERIFKACDPHISRLYSLAREPKLEKEAAAIYESIEAFAGRFMFRADFLEHNNLDLIVRGRSSPFELPATR